MSSSPGQPRLRPAPPLSVTQSRAGPRWWRGGLVAARNGVAVVGTLFLAWSATNLSVLYFANFLAGLGAIATTYRLRFPGVTDADGLWDHAYTFLSALRTALVAMATVGIPFGLPLLFVSARAGSPRTCPRGGGSGAVQPGMAWRSSWRAMISRWTSDVPS